MALLSQARRLRAEAHAAEALATPAQGLDGVDPERAEDLLELVAPGMHEVGEALGAPLRVQTPSELGLLRGQAPAAAAGVAALAKVTAQRDERRGADGHDVGPKSDRLGHVGRRADRAGRDDRGAVANTLVAQPLVHDGDGDLQGDTDVVADHLWRRARAPAKAVEVHVVGAGVDDSGGDRGDVVHGRDLGALPDLDLHGGAAVEVLRVHAEAPRGHLHDHVVLVREQVGVQAALAGVHEDAAALGGPRQGAVHVERHRSVAHRREDDGRLELHVVAQAGAALEAEAATAVRLDLHRVRLAAQVRAQLHVLAQGVDGRVGDLARVEHEMIEPAEVRLVVAHAGEHHRAGLGLSPDGLAQADLPRGVVAEGQRTLLDGDGVRRAERHAAVTGPALGVVRQRALVEGVHAPAALLHAAPAALTAVVIDAHAELGLDEGRGHDTYPSVRSLAVCSGERGEPAWTRATTGSPARGAQTSSGASSTSRIALSSEATMRREP